MSSLSRGYTEQRSGGILRLLEILIGESNEAAGGSGKASFCWEERAVWDAASHKVSTETLEVNGVGKSEKNQNQCYAHLVVWEQWVNVPVGMVHSEHVGWFQVRNKDSSWKAGSDSF